MEKNYILGKLSVVNIENVMKIKEEVKKVIFSKNLFNETELIFQFLKILTYFDFYNDITLFNGLIDLNNLDIYKKSKILNYLIFANLKTDFHEENIKLLEHIDLNNVNKENKKSILINFVESLKVKEKYEVAINLLEKHCPQDIRIPFLYFEIYEFKKSEKMFKTRLKNVLEEDEEVLIYFGMYDLYKKQNMILKAEKYLKQGEKKFRFLKKNTYKITRSYILYEFYKEKDRMKALLYLKNSLTKYDTINKMDSDYRKKAYNEAVQNNLFSKKTLKEMIL